MNGWDGAEWDPVDAPSVRFTSEVRKVVHHKTQTSGGSTRALYGPTGATAPHFTVGPDRVRQHYGVNVGSRSLENHPGGVETNSDGVIQIETIGWSGATADPQTMDNLVALLRWLQDEHGIPWVWPAGRPVDSNDPRDTETWALAGHFGHSQVPENNHGDPAYTDDEWFALNTRLGAAHVLGVDPAPQPQPPHQEYKNVDVRHHTIAMTLGPDGRGWALTADALASPLFVVKHQGRYSPIGAADVYGTDVFDWHSFLQDGHVEVVVDAGVGGATVGFEIFELVPS